MSALFILCASVLFLFPVWLGIEFFVSTSPDSWWLTDWFPEEHIFGLLLPMTGTLMLVALTFPLTMIIAFMCGMGLSEIRHHGLKKMSLSLLQTWNSVPSIIIGLWGMSSVIPVIRTVYGTGYCYLTTAFCLMLLMLPSVMILIHHCYLNFLNEYRYLNRSLEIRGCEEALFFIRCYPEKLAQISCYSLGRIFGETTVVLMLSGNSMDLSVNPFSGFRSLSATLALEMPYSSGIHQSALFGIAGLSLLMTGFFCLLSLGVRVDR